MAPRPANMSQIELSKTPNGPRRAIGDAARHCAQNGHEALTR